MAWGFRTACFAIMLSSLPLFGEDWPQWRGPNRNGISQEKGWLDHWPAEGPKVAWKTGIGTGFSSFSVAKGRVFSMGNADNTDTVFCFDATSGKPLWKHTYPADLGDKYFEGGTTGTPTIDGDRVFTFSRWGDVFCLDAASAKVVWTRNLQKDSGMRVPGWGFAGSPTILNNLLLLNIGESGMALDKATGKTVWQSADKEAGYSTPLPWQRSGKWLVLVSSGQAYLAVDAQTGKEQWHMRWLTQYGVNAADPVIDGDKVFISSGYGKGAALLKPGAGTEPQVLWKSKVLRTQINGAILVNGFLYGSDGDSTDKPVLKCVDIATGTEKWSEPGATFGAMMVADGRLILLSDHGELMTAPATPDGFKPAARAQVLGGKCWTAPVLANGFIYCRNSRGDMVCLDVRGKAL
jgi:outer membrane protein assembly factor BamB